MFALSLGVVQMTASRGAMSPTASTTRGYTENRRKR